MKTHLAPLDIETDAGHHDWRRYRAQNRGIARRQTKQALTHLSRAAALHAPPPGEENTEFLQLAGALPAETSIE
jgi:hypothetical protein